MDIYIQASMHVKDTAFSAVARTPHVLQAVMIALDPTQNAKLPRDVLLESCIQAPVLLACYERKFTNTCL
jgi:transcription antitermination factor NusG